MAITVTVNAPDTVDARRAIKRAEVVLNVKLVGSADIVAKAGLILFFIIKHFN